MTLRTAAEVQEDREFVRACLDELAAIKDRELDDEESVRWAEGMEALETYRAEDDQREARRAELERFAALSENGPEEAPMTRPEAARADSDADMMNAWERSRAGDPQSGLRDEVRRYADRALTDDFARQRAEELVSGIGVSGGGSPQAASERAAQHLAVHGSDRYNSAFAKWTAGQERGYMVELDADEARALEAADHLRAFMNVGTGTAGGLQVPSHLNPTIRLMNQSAQDGVSSIATHETLVGPDTWNGVSSAGVSVEYPGENTQVADGSPTIVSLSIGTDLFDIFVAASIQYDHHVGMGSQLQRLFDDAMARNAATVFTTGTGSGQPTGIVTALDAVSTSEVATDTALTVDADDIKDLLYSELPAGFRGRATWLMNDAYRSHIHGFGTTDNLWTTDLSSGYSERLLGRPVQSASAMITDVTPATGANAIVVGDFSNYIIVHSLEARVEYIANLMGANQRPLGSRGWVLYGIHGGGIGSTETGTDGPANAFRLLQGGA